MPKGVYARTENQLRASVANLALGHEAKAREKARATQIVLATDPTWRKKVSDGTRAAMRRPEVRTRHLAGLERARSKHGPNYAGGNGQDPTGAQEEMRKRLEPLGFVREYPIKTKGHGTGERVPTCYKADFANPKTKVIVELDGPSHKQREEIDAKKTRVLEALGWTVRRVKHRTGESL